MRKLLYGTGNPAKLHVMRSRLSALPVEIIGLREIERESGILAPDPVEDGNSPLQNARKKAMAYYETYGMPVFSCDSGLYCQELPEESQPGVHVRAVGGKYLSDEEMQRYYAALAGQYQGLTARYRNAVCLVMDREHIYEKMDESLAGEPFLLTEEIRPVREKGFPLDSLSVQISTGKHYYDLEEEQVERYAVGEGFLAFFREILRI